MLCRLEVGCSKTDKLTNQVYATQILSDLYETNTVRESGAHVVIGDVDLSSVEGV